MPTGQGRLRDDRGRWDARYAAGDWRHDVGPAPLLAQWVSRWPPGRALDVAAGLGRHALLLARGGWTVDAVDLSLEGLRILRGRARTAGVRLNLVLSDIGTFACRPASYDLIVNTFFLDRRLIPRYRRWLRPGGMVYFETHVAIPGRPTRSRFALRPGEARRLFARWEILDGTEGPVDDGTRVIETARLVARRPLGDRTLRTPHRIGGAVAARRAGFAVAIDGPMGSGKSTVARELARRLGFQYVDTGAMYRAIAVAALRRGVALDDAALGALAGSVTLALEPMPDGSARVRVDGEDVTGDLRSVEVNRIVSRVARVPAVRQALGALQRSLGRRGKVVMEGRDIGSVILPEAQVKVFLTAAIDVRAQRRQAELAASGTPMPLGEIQRIVAEDDHAATTREVAPLRRTPDAMAIDSTALTVDQVVDRIVGLVERARGL